MQNRVSFIPDKKQAKRNRFDAIIHRQTRAQPETKITQDLNNLSYYFCKNGPPLPSLG
jgi:hypothetical protein